MSVATAIAGMGEGQSRLRVARAPRTFRLDAVVFAAILVIGAARLPTPFGGDQALNLLMGQTIAGGGAPYRDLWDLKHPGVFLFNGAGGALFGFDEIGIHLFELLWMVALALLVRVAAARWLETWAASLAPALTVGIYFAVAGERFLTQTEALVGLPLLASLWCAIEARHAGRGMKWWLVASGLAAGIVMVFKIPYIAIPAVFWVQAIRDVRADRGERLSRTVHDTAPWLLAGTLLPVLGTVTYLALKGVAGLFFWTAFQHPAESAAVTTIEPRRLLRAIRSMAVLFAPVLPLAALGVARSVRGRMDPMASGLCAWVSVAALLIGMQAISWWDYHFLLLLVPLGLLAARGVETAGTAVTASLGPPQPRLIRVALTLGLVLLFAPQIASAARVTWNVWRARPLPFSPKGLVAYQAKQYPEYASVRDGTAFLRDARSHPGPIYVIDTPVYYVHAARAPAIPLLAPWFHPTDRLWQHLREELTAAHPPYVRVSASALDAIAGYRPSLRGEVEAIVPLVETRYEPLHRDETGTWYVRRDLAANDRSRTR